MKRRVGIYHQQLCYSYISGLYKLILAWVDHLRVVASIASDTDSADEDVLPDDVPNLPQLQQQAFKQDPDIQFGRNSSIHSGGYNLLAPHKTAAVSRSPDGTLRPTPIKLEVPTIL